MSKVPISVPRTGVMWMRSRGVARSQDSAFSCTTSFDSANVAAASAGSSAGGIGSRPRADTAVVPKSAA